MQDARSSSGTSPTLNSNEMDALCSVLFEPTSTPMPSNRPKISIRQSSAEDDGNNSSTSSKSLKFCSKPNCNKRVRSRGLCKAHGGGKRCKVSGCTKSSQGQGLCIRHGGGKRCRTQFCDKAAQSNGLCKAHGGGLRCQVEGCGKSSQGGGLCRSHGGGQRCSVANCEKGAQRGGLCASHGGNRLCGAPGCHKNDRGGGFCAAHGGGRRCSVEGCNAPVRKLGKCTFHAVSPSKRKNLGDRKSYYTVLPVSPSWTERSTPVVNWPASAPSIYSPSHVSSTQHPVAAQIEPNAEMMRLTAVSPTIVPEHITGFNFSLNSSGVQELLDEKEEM